MVYSDKDLQSMRETLTPGVEKATLLAKMQLYAASRLAGEIGMEATDATTLAIAQVIATNWAGLD